MYFYYLYDQRSVISNLNGLSMVGDGVFSSKSLLILLFTDNYSKSGDEAGLLIYCLISLKS